MNDDKFVCAHCMGVFPKICDETWNEEMKLKEYQERFPECVERNDPVVEICDDCYNRIMCQ